VAEIYDSVEKRERVNLIVYDFKNAFGCLVPDILINKLRANSLDDVAISWVKSFLSDRQQFVHLKTFYDNNIEIVMKSVRASSSMGDGRSSGNDPWPFWIELLK
jgi:hypothetical protein